MMRKIAIVPFLFIFVLSLQLDAAEKTKKFRKAILPPIDESVKDPSLKKVIDALKTAVKKKDRELLLKHVSKDIKTDFGGGGGIENFRKMWALDSAPQKSPIWKELSNILRNGGKFMSGDAKSYAVPYYFVSFPDDLDAFEYAVLTGERINVREKPDMKAPVVAVLSYEIVKGQMIPDDRNIRSTIDGETWSWAEITTSEGKSGYVFGKYFGSPIGYRAIFSQENGRWLMQVFVAGD